MPKEFDGDVSSFIVFRKTIRPKTSDVREHNVYNHECKYSQNEDEWVSVLAPFIPFRLATFQL